MLIPGNERGGPWRIALVDDDTGVLRSLSRMLSVYGYEVTTFLSAADFLTSIDHAPPPPEIAVVDLRMPETDGLKLQSLLKERGVRIPTVFLSGHGDVPTSVRAILEGAVDFLEKPCDDAALLASLQRAADVARRDRETRQQRQELENRVQELEKRLAKLTRREREVFHWVASGALNKQIAAELGTKEKTIKVHRARVMTKMKAHSVAELVVMFIQLGGPMLLRDDDAPPRPPRPARTAKSAVRRGDAISATPQRLDRAETAPPPRHRSAGE